MFVLQPKPTFKVDVEIQTTTGLNKIKFEFKHKGKKALKAFYETLAPEGGPVREDQDALLELIENWSGADEKFSPETLDTLLDNYHGSAKAIFDAFNKGLFEGGQKN